jgi:hypothetical protein
MRYAKAIAALLGGLSPIAIVGFLALFHVGLDATLVTEVLAIASPLAATLATAAGPANKVDAVVDAAVKAVELPEVKTEIAKVETLPVVAEVLKDVRATIPVPNPADAPTA